MIAPNKQWRSSMATTFALPHTHRFYDFPMEILCSLPKGQFVVCAELGGDMDIGIREIIEAAGILSQRGYPVEVGMRQILDSRKGSRNAKSVWLEQRGWPRAVEDARAYWTQVHHDD